MKAKEIKDNVFKKIMILRTRKYIMSEFGEDGKIRIRGKLYTFKDPIPDKITYKSDEAKYNTYNKFLEGLDEEFEDLEFAFTKLYSSGYVAFTPKDSIQNGKEESQKKIMVPINAILKFLLAKRLESSIFAFERTLTKLEDKNKIFLKLIKSFIVKTENLSDDEFLEEIQEFSLNCIIKADKEDAIKDFQEDDVDVEEGAIDPRLRLIYNIVSNTNNDLLENLTEYMKKEDDFYQYVKSSTDKSNLINLFRSGLEFLHNEMDRDKEIFRSVKNVINNIKVQENNEIKILGEFTENKISIKIPEYHDPKIMKLKEIIYEDLVSKKFIIFTQYKDTAIYLYRVLYPWLLSQK